MMTYKWVETCSIVLYVINSTVIQLYLFCRLMEDPYLRCIDGLIYMIMGEVPNMRHLSFHISEVLTPNEHIRNCLIQEENVILH